MIASGERQNWTSDVDINSGRNMIPKKPWTLEERLDSLIWLSADAGLVRLGRICWTKSKGCRGDGSDELREQGWDVLQVPGK